MKREPAEPQGFIKPTGVGIPPPSGRGGSQYEYLTTSAKNDPELNEHDKETVLAFLKRLDTNPDKYAVAPRTIAYLNEESLEYADITTETLKKLDMSATQLLDEWWENVWGSATIEDDCLEGLNEVLELHGVSE